MSVTVVLREIEDNEYTECLGDKQGVLREMYKWRLERSPVCEVYLLLWVWKRREVISEGTGMCSTFSIATWVKKNSTFSHALKRA